MGERLPSDKSTHYHTSGTGHLYQARFKSFPVKGDVHLLLVLRYVECNALRVNLVARGGMDLVQPLAANTGRDTVMLSNGR